MQQSTHLAIACLIGLVSVNHSLMAMPVWVGTADYRVLDSDTTSDEDKVGPFDTYDFRANSDAVLTATSGNLDSNFEINETFKLVYETRVDTHFLANSPVTASQLNSGYELTFYSEVDLKVSSIQQTSGVTTTLFDVTGGFGNLWFDDLPDADFQDGVKILEGHVDGNFANTVQFSTNPLVGLVDIMMQVSNYNTAVFDPDTIDESNGLFSILLDNVSGSDLNFTADGFMQLTAVPVPLSVWLFGSALFSLVGFGRVRRIGTDSANL